VRRRALLQLFRPPNLFTVPGDPLCGYLIASGGRLSWHVIPAIGISVALYCAGLIVNDLADFSEDLRDRPMRPLPSGGVAVKAANTIAIVLISIAVILANLVNATVAVIAVILVNEILFYNVFAKKNAFVGPIAMGLCRGSSVLIGAAAILPFHPSSFVVPAYAGPVITFYFGNLHFGFRNSPYLAAGVITLYIAGVTALARKETSNPRIPPLIGSLIRGLLFIQAGFCASAGGYGWVAAILLLALWPVSRLVSSRFYAS